MQAPVERVVPLGFSPDLAAILGPMLRSRSDPTLRFQDGCVWRTADTPAGPVSQRLGLLRSSGSAAVSLVSSCWGPGADWMSQRAGDVVGTADDPSGFPPRAAVGQPAVEVIAGLHERSGRSWRVPRAHNVWESAVAAVLEQKVTGLEAKRAWRGLAARFGSPAPGPAPSGMLVFPTPQQMRLVPTWTWRRLGVDRSRSDTIMRLAAIPHVVNALPDLDAATARARLTSIAGVGPWTYAEVAHRALGDADAVSVGDFHLAKEVVFALTGCLDGDDDEMLRLLAPFAPHRYRAVRMIELSGVRRPRRGPRLAIPAHRYG